MNYLYMFTIILWTNVLVCAFYCHMYRRLFWNTILKTTFSWFTLERMNVQPNNDYHQIRLFNALRLVYVKCMCAQYCPSLEHETTSKKTRYMSLILKIFIFQNNPTWGGEIGWGSIGGLGKWIIRCSKWV